MLRKDMFLEVRGKRKACVLCVAALAAVTAAAADLAVTCETNALAQATQELPTGAGNFTVELPQTTGGATVRAADFGFSSANDVNQEAITRAAEECRRVGAARLELAPGIYRCFGTNGVRLVGLKDVTIDGRGALLVFRRPAAGARPNFHIRNCERIELKDFTMDWDWTTDPLGDFVEVMGTHVGEKADNSSYFDVRFPGMDRHPVYPRPLAVADFNPMTMTPDGKIAFRDAFKTSDGNEILGDLHSGSLGAKSEWLSPCTLRVWPHVRAETGVRNATWNGFFRPDWNLKVVRDKVKVGATYRLLHYYYGEGGFVMDSNAHLTLRDITVWSCRGHGFCVSGSQHHWQLLNVKLEPPQVAAVPSPSRRVVTATSDGTHVVQSNGYCLYDGCVFRLTNDDTWNFHDVTSPVRRRDARTLVCVSPYGTSRVRAKPGDVVELAAKDFTPIPWRGRIVSVAKDAFTVDANLPEGDEIRLLFDRSHATTHVRFNNCLVEDTHFRGLIYSHDTTVENCTFRRTGGHSLSFEVYYNLERSAEGSGVTNVVVRGCTFEESERRLNYSDSATIRTTATVNPRSVAPKTLHRGVFGQFLFENNRFVNPRGMCLKMNAVRDLVFRNNDIELKSFRGNQRYTQGWLGFENSENVCIEGNRWHMSPSVTNAPAIRLEGDSPHFFQTGNRLMGDSPQLFEGDSPQLFQTGNRTLLLRRTGDDGKIDEGTEPLKIGSFENPVIPVDWPDPTVWNGGDGWYYSVATMLRTVRRSRNLTHWEDMRRSPLTDEARTTLTNISRNVWAPSVVRIGKKWLLYVSLFRTDADCRIAVLSSDSPCGPFSYCGLVIESAKIGILNTIDPYVFEAEGKVWMTFGSCQDGVHLIELGADGLAVKPGSVPVHLAGLRFRPDVKMWGYPGTYEGSYVLRRNGWWYLFVSGGLFNDGSYYLTVGRSKELAGDFLDQDGRSLREGKARPILASKEGDRFVGPGHNGDVFTSADGRDWMFVHAHDTTMADKSARPTLLKELKWTESGWPFFR